MKRLINNSRSSANEKTLFLAGTGESLQRGEKQRDREKRQLRVLCVRAQPVQHALTTQGALCLAQPAAVPALTGELHKKCASGEMRIRSHLASRPGLNDPSDV